MRWNWQQDDWPEFQWGAAALAGREAAFLRESGKLAGAFAHLSEGDQADLRVAMLSAEALKTSAIEGEILDRDSVQSSIRRAFGLQTDHRRIGPQEQGVAALMVDLYRGFDAPLSAETLFSWHELLMGARRDLSVIGGWRTHDDPMQVVSGPINRPQIHFEAPPSSAMPAEMARFIDWFDQTRPASGVRPLPILTRAALAHHWFVCIHPFEDGNGRIARALAEKAMAQGLGQPSLIALSQRVEQERKGYYAVLKRENKTNEITGWIDWFADAALGALDDSQRRVTFLIEKTRLHDALRGQINARQAKVLERMFREGPRGFTGGLSAGNYASITNAARATVTRDLADLVEKGALFRRGERRYARYFLNVPTFAGIRNR